ncbi:MAG: acetyl-CoA carboxylase, biotin carboxyl carrier protein, partial [Acidobacteriaceae bacterium]
MKRMNAGQLQSLKDLIEFLKQQEVGEFDLEQDGLKVHLSFAGRSAGNVDLSQLTHLLQHAPAAPAHAVAAPVHLPSVAAGATAV